MTEKEAEKYMRFALSLALKGEGRTHPNPMVGAVIVSGGKVIGQGYHVKAGLPHAEVLAIKNSKTSLKGAVMFVTLEPCDHHGKTPPCTEAIIKSGIKKVYTAMKDPNPVNSGRGIQKLRRSGIDVKVGLCNAEARFLNRAYVKFISSGMPYVTVKLAQTMDGKIAANDGTSKWISSLASRRYVKKLRSSADAVMVGVNTVLTDDPTLMAGKRPGKKVLRIVLDSKLRMPENSRLVNTSGCVPLVLATTSAASPGKVKSISRKKGVEVILLNSDKGKVDLGDLLRTMADRGVVKIISEGGGVLSGALLDGNFVDEVVFFIAPKILGGQMVSVKGKGKTNISEAILLKEVKVLKSGVDILVTAQVEKKTT